MGATVTHGFQPTAAVASTAMSPDELAQLTEVADLLDVAKRTAAKYVNLPGFPEPVDTLSTGRVWVRADVAKWGKANLPLRTGRPPKQP
jgi:predicted DNA-binding transcriptional regulator AlpA